ncbi:MAG: N-6 DNA methylase, partial [Planctomycetes bacterium]|nr:N-6 DNA methylase [Planctomycetota bacterium]
RLFHDNPLAERQPKTDRLILGRLLRDAARSNQLDGDELEAAHQVLIKWAELESKGRLAKLHETQLQGEFLSEVFGQALGYQLATDDAETWHLEREHQIAGQAPDAILGRFTAHGPHQPRAIIELKGPAVHLDRDRSNGRTAVQQTWDYLNQAGPDCRWGITSNIISFRLYERSSTPRRYEHFSLQSLRDRDTFRAFYVLFHRRGLIQGTAGQPPRAAGLLEKTNNRQREVGDELYQYYSEHRTRLIAHLHHDLGHPLDDAIEYAQRLLDRVFFIAFCEDRGLLPDDTIKRALENLPGFSAVTNPRWQNFKTLFRFVDTGHPESGIPGYNGGLFAVSPADDLDLDDRWTTFFSTLQTYDFADEVNLDVLGHLFERSITELEKLREGGLFGGDAAKAEQYAAMPQSAKRKRMGIYYTPPELTALIVEYTLGDTIQQRWRDLAVTHGIDTADADHLAPDTADYWRDAVAALRRLTVVDPACGSGAFLFQAYELLEHRYFEAINHLLRFGEPDADAMLADVPRYILEDNLYGVDLSPEAVEITQLALWIRSATRGQTLARLSGNIVHGNSLVHDPEADPHGFDWAQRFPQVFEKGGFDCVIGNPPWERIKLKHREFFALAAPEILRHTNASKQRAAISALEQTQPVVYQRYLEAKQSAEYLLAYVKDSGRFPLVGKGDVNLYATFAELASRIVAPAGRVGLLVPSGIASDKTTKDFFASIAEHDRLIRLYDFENKKVFFPEVHASFKFCILNFRGAAPGDAPGAKDETAPADFVFFAHSVEELEDPRRHIALSGDDIKLLNPNTRTCPIFRGRRDAEITKAIYRRVPVLLDRSRRGPAANPWGVSFKRMFDQTNDAELFREAADLQKQGFKLNGNRFVHPKKKAVYLPLYEAKMVQMFDHRAADVVTDRDNWVRQGQTEKRSLVSYQNPEDMAMPRYWISHDEVVIDAIGSPGFKDITSPTNQRTMIAAWGPEAGYTNHFVLVDTDLAATLQCCMLANLNSYVWDFCVRQKIGGVTLNFFIVEQVPTFIPDTYTKPCPWDRTTTLEAWISERVLKLTCTAEDMLPLAEACGFTSGSFAAYEGKLHQWDEADRAQLMAELDAAYFHLYGLERGDAEYILSTFKGIHEPMKVFGGSSTAEHVLDTYDHLAAGR